jgi:tRNA pseudouridine55 synthase
MDGLILVDKPQGLTSHDVVLKVRKILSEPRVGHFGTLDPLATGLLLLGAGQATRLFPLFAKKDKRYRGTIRLGYSTDTYDAMGRQTSPEVLTFPDRGRLAEAGKKFVGPLMQVPPPYSAKKLAGRPLYKWARAKKPVSPAPSEVLIYSFKLLAYSPPRLEFEVHCSSGTYIRSLAHELGQSVRCGGHLEKLRRLAVGDYEVGSAQTLAKIEALAGAAKTAEFLLPLEKMFPEYPKVILGESAVRGLQRGRAIPADQVIEVHSPEKDVPTQAVETGECSRLYNLQGQFLGLARMNSPDGSWLPFFVRR